jgi:hypothetical protein
MDQIEIKRLRMAGCLSSSNFTELRCIATGGFGYSIAKTGSLKDDQGGPDVDKGLEPLVRVVALGESAVKVRMKWNI